MSEFDLSILIVHTFEAGLVRQTLRGIRRSSPKIRVEVLVIDNNPAAGLKEMIQTDFPEVRYLVTEGNRGFGSAMNRGIAEASGKYILIFNPDIIVSPGSLESLHAYMEAHPEIGIIGPKLLNADGSLQYSCSRFHDLTIPLYRRTPIGRLSFARKTIDAFLMKDVSHDETMEVDWLMGSALFTRRTALEQVGSFDDTFFMYFEDTDLCRRFWKKGWKVMYFPHVAMVHYHRRASADGSLFQQLMSPLTWSHIRSAMLYFRKYQGQPNPRELLQLSAASGDAAPLDAPSPGTAAR